MISKNPTYFSDYFDVDKSKLKELGVFDPILNFDTKVFVEPLLLKKSESEIIRSSASHFDHFFIELLKLLKASKQEGDKPWREAKRRVYFPEYKYTCIGYGTNSIDGSGSGKWLNDKILHSAKDIVEFAKDDPAIFLILPLLEEGIGADIISDMTQTIIDENICKFTVDIQKKLNLEGGYKYETQNGNIYKLLKNPFNKCSIKLLPRDVLSDLPLANSFEEWLANTSDANRHLRNVVNRHIGTSWHKETKSQIKERLLELIKSDKGFFIEVLRALQDYDFDHYDLEEDWQGLHKWLRDSEKFIDYSPTNNHLKLLNDDLEEIRLSVREIVKSFKNSIENKELWRIFWTKSDLKLLHVKEFYSQMLFYMVANVWMDSKSNNLSCNRTFNKTTKQIEFRFSVGGKYVVNVQIKHSANYGGLQKSYDKKVDENISRLEEMDYFLVMSFDEKGYKQLDSIKKKQSNGYEVIEIDVSNQENKEGDLFENALTDSESGDMLTEFEGGDIASEEMHFAERSKGGKARHSLTSMIKNEIVRPMFENYKLIKGTSVKQRADKIHNLLSDLLSIYNDASGKDSIQEFANKYVLSTETLEKARDYFQDDKAQTIYKWCRNFDN